MLCRFSCPASAVRSLFCLSSLGLAFKILGFVGGHGMFTRLDCSGSSLVQVWGFGCSGSSENGRSEDMEQCAFTQP